MSAGGGVLRPGGRLGVIAGGRDADAIVVLASGALASRSGRAAGGRTVNVRFR